MWKKEKNQRRFPGNGMNRMGDMVLFTGYPVVMVVIVVVEITTIEVNATIALVAFDDNIEDLCCISSTKKLIKT